MQRLRKGTWRGPLGTPQPVARQAACTARSWALPQAALRARPGHSPWFFEGGASAPATPACACHTLAVEMSTPVQLFCVAPGHRFQPRCRSMPRNKYPALKFQRRHQNPTPQTTCIALRTPFLMPARDAAAAAFFFRGLRLPIVMPLLLSSPGSPLRPAVLWISSGFSFKTRGHFCSQSDSPPESYGRHRQ